MNPNAAVRTNAAGLAAARDRNRSMPNIDSMPAGPELDALVARDVMGWSFCRGGIGPMYRIVTPGDPPTVMVRSCVEWNPSSDLVHALEVVERMRGLGYSFAISAGPSGDFLSAFEIFDPRLMGGNDLIENASLGDGVCPSGQTIALAICRAALIAVSK